MLYKLKYITNKAGFPKRKACFMVEATGLEPAASWSQTKRDTKLRHASILFIHNKHRSLNEHFLHLLCLNIIQQDISVVNTKLQQLPLLIFCCIMFNEFTDKIILKKYVLEGFYGKGINCCIQP